MAGRKYARTKEGKFATTGGSKKRGGGEGGGGGGGEGEVTPESLIGAGGDAARKEALAKLDKMETVKAKAGDDAWSESGQEVVEHGLPMGHTRGTPNITVSRGQTGEVLDVPVKDLRTTRIEGKGQKHVVRELVSDYIESTEWSAAPPIKVLRKKLKSGKTEFLIWNGHHRAVTMKLLGSKNIPAEVIGTT